MRQKQNKMNRGAQKTKAFVDEDHGGSAVEITRGQIVRQFEKIARAGRQTALDFIATALEYAPINYSRLMQPWNAR